MCRVLCAFIAVSGISAAIAADSKDDLNAMQGTWRPTSGAGFFGHADNAGKEPTQGGQDDRLGRLVRFGHRRAIAFQPGWRAGVVVAKNLLAGRFGDASEGGK